MIWRKLRNNMTSWHRKAIKQHKEVRTPKYKQRVVPLIRNEKRDKAIEQVEAMEINELNSSGTGPKIS